MVKKAKKQFSCENCFKKFASKWHLKTHFLIHSDLKPFKCPYIGCNKAFNAKKNLEVHFRKHTGERPFPCYLCSKRFAQKTTLDQHLRFHLNIRPFKCGFCEKRFIQTSNLNEHLRVHHKKEGEEEEEFNLKIVKVFSILEQEVKPVKEEEVGTMKVIPNYSKNLILPQTTWWYQCKVCKVFIEDEQKFLLHRLKHPNYDDPIVIDISSDESSEEEEAKEEVPAPAQDGRLSPSSSEDSRTTEELGNMTMFSVDTTNLYPSASASSAGTEDDIFSLIEPKLAKRERVGPKCAKRKWKIQEDNLRMAIDNSLNDQMDEESQVPSESRNSPPAAESTSQEAKAPPAPEVATTSKKCWVCSVCTKMYPFRANLNFHLSVAHLSNDKTSDGLKIFKCGLCSKEFNDKKTLSVHTWGHTKEIRYKCPNCSEGFTFNNDYVKHSKSCLPKE